MSSVGSFGGYWSSTPDGVDYEYNVYAPYYMGFSSYVYTSVGPRNYGQAVRLVR